MIAKRVMRKVDSLCKSSFFRLANYIGDIANHRDKVRDKRIRLSHCKTDDFDLSLKAVYATQSLNTRSKADKSYHLVISFRSGEHPTQETIDAIEDYMVAGLGYGAHQRISAVHNDTDNLHLHIAINKIHPENYRAIEPYYDFYKLDRMCKELEIKYDLKKDNRIENVRRKVKIELDTQPRSEGARSTEKKQGFISFERWVKQTLSNKIKHLSEYKTWESLHKELTTYGLEIRLRGSGLVISHKKDKLFIKASAVHRKLSKAALEAKLGAFVPPSENIKKKRENYSYQHKKPFRGYRHDERFYSEWKKDCKEKYIIKSTSLKKEFQKKIHETKQLNNRYRVKVHLLKLSDPAERSIRIKMIKASKIKELALIQSTFYQAQKTIRQQNKTDSWTDYVVKYANKNSDIWALHILRQKPRDNSLHEEDNTFSKVNNKFSAWDNESNPIFRKFEHTIKADGTVIYKISDHNYVKDRGRNIEVEGYDMKTLIIGLKIAKERYGNCLNITGSDTFKAHIAQLSAEHCPEIKFTDLVVEQAKEAVLSAMKEKQYRERQRSRNLNPDHDRGFER